MSNQPGTEAVLEKGHLRSNRWLLARRISQISVLALFLIGPLMGVWIIKGNLSSSLLLNTVPFADPLLVLQSLFASHVPEVSVLLGAAIIAGFYALIGGRMFCSWVCPINPVTDLAEWLRRQFHIKPSKRASRQLRYWLLGLCLFGPLATGLILWELVNPVSYVYRALLFGGGIGWLLVVAVFLFDLFVSRKGWCGHLCPMGAFYSLIGKKSLLRVSATRRDQCNDCMDCFVVCPEPQVIKIPLRAVHGAGPVIQSSDCTNCGRCIDVCSQNVFQFGSRFANKAETSS